MIAFARLLMGHRYSVTLFWSHRRILRRPDKLQVAKCWSWRMKNTFDSLLRKVAVFLRADLEEYLFLTGPAQQFRGK